jgi:hypothetical protein
VPVEIERQPHAVDQREEPLGRHGRGQRLLHAAGPAVLEMDELGVVGDQLESLPRGEVQTLADPRELQQHGGKGLARHHTSSRIASAVGMIAEAAARVEAAQLLTLFIVDDLALMR